MFIKLAPGQNFWMLMHPADNSLLYYMSAGSPGPIDVDFDNLTPDNQEAVTTGLYHRRILLATAEEMAGVEQVDMEAIPAMKISTTESQARELVLLSIAGLQRKLPDVLRQDNALAVLDMVIALENQGENANGVPRKTMIQMLENNLKELGGVTDVIEDTAYEMKIKYDTPAA